GERDAGSSCRCDLGSDRLHVRGGPRRADDRPALPPESKAISRPSFLIPTINRVSGMFVVPPNGYWLTQEQAGVVSDPRHPQVQPPSSCYTLSRWAKQLRQSPAIAPVTAPRRSVAGIRDGLILHSRTSAPWR